MKHFNSLDGNLNHKGFNFINTGVFILFYYFSNRNFFPVYLKYFGKGKGSRLRIQQTHEVVIGKNFASCRVFYRLDSCW